MFTWCSSYGRAKSRLDRFVAYGGIISRWNNLGQVMGLRNILNHEQIWIKCCKLDWGPKSFKVNRCWFEHEYFLNFVKKE